MERTGTGIVVKGCCGREPEAVVPVPVPVNGSLAGIDGPLGSEIVERCEIDPVIWGAGKCGAYSYSYDGAGRFVNAGVGAGAGAWAGAATLECGRVDLRTGGG